MSKLNRILLIIVIILAAATALVWFKPDLLDTFSSYSWADLNPFKGKHIASEIKEESPDTPVPASAIAQLPSPEQPLEKSTTGQQPASAEKIESIRNQEGEEGLNFLTPFEKDIKQRQDSYQSKIFTYEPYELPVHRNPFQRTVSTVYFSEAEEKLAQELGTEEDIRKFVQPELPPGTQYSGFISSGETKLAIIELEEETYIVKEGDTLLDNYLVILIETDKVIIDINGYSIPIKLGGEEAGND